MFSIAAHARLAWGTGIRRGVYLAPGGRESVFDGLGFAPTSGSTPATLLAKTKHQKTQERGSHHACPTSTPPSNHKIGPRQILDLDMIDRDRIAMAGINDHVTIVEGHVVRHEVSKIRKPADMAEIDNIMIGPRAAEPIVIALAAGLGVIARSERKRNVYSGTVIPGADIRRR
jgi:hypothetical protein